MEELAWEFNNAPRWLSPDKPVKLGVYRGENKFVKTEVGESTRRGNDMFILFFSTVHSILDGVGTLIITNELFELIGGSGLQMNSSPMRRSTPRTETELRDLLETEWTLRYGSASPLRSPRIHAGSSSSPSIGDSGLLPDSFEARIEPPSSRESERIAHEDFVKDQAQSLVSVVLCPN